jgi:hypothetical protein
VSQATARAEANVQSDWSETNTSSDSYIKNKPTSMPASGGNADTVDGKHESEFATAAQGAKADTALQSFTETDPTVPAWAKAAAKPSYNFNEITGLMSALQLPDNLINGINNVSANFNSATEQWDVSAEIPFVFECNGVNDNERLSNLVKDFYNSTTLADNANLKVVVKGKLGVTNTRLYGSGTYADNYRVFEFGVEGFTGNRRVLIKKESDFKSNGVWNKLKKVDVIIIDEIFYTNLSDEEIKLLYKSLVFLNETRKLIFVTNRSLSEWIHAANDKHLIQTFIDRILANAEILRTNK